MHIGVQMGGKIWGAYPFTKGHISVSYSNSTDCLSVGNPKLWYGYFLTHWVGKRAPADLFIKDRAGPIIAHNEEITHRHAELFAQHYFEIGHNVGWDECFQDCMLWCRDKQEESVRSGGWQPEEILITFRHDDTRDDMQRYSYVQLTAEVAQWLGETLMTFTHGPHAPDTILSTRVGCEDSAPIKSADDATQANEGAEHMRTPTGENEGTARVLQFPTRP